MEERIANQLDLPVETVEGTLALLDDGNTVPFIARYRKEQTGGLDEVQIRDVNEKAESIRELEDRRQTILETIEEQDELTDGLRKKIERASTQSQLEDLYAPYRPRQVTRATRAREAGLEPVAERIREGDDPRNVAPDFTTDEYESTEDVLQGARDILAEDVTDDPEIRGFLRKQAWDNGRWVCSKRRGADGDSTYENYYDFSKPVDQVEPHQILAIRRGENEKELSAKLTLNDDQLINRIAGYCIDVNGVAKQHFYEAVQDGYNRLLHPAIERDVRSELEDRADRHAIDNFSLNLRNLLLQPPMPDTVVLGIDPGQRTGCKLSVIETTGELIDTDQIFVHDERRERAPDVIREIVRNEDVDLVAIGNGTASRETEEIVAEALGEFSDVQYAIVDEAGASVYSASEVARTELPDLDVSYRGAVSIARRLQDPLAELVKIDPRSIGVGMYQHDVNESDLETALDAVVEDVVNSVGVDLNSASSPLLARVAGIGPTLADRIVEHREQKGSFESREALESVKGMGPKTFKQCAGFLRIRDGKEPLDNTGIHPENYDLARSILDEIGAEPGDEDLTAKLEELQSSGRLEAMAKNHDVGSMTLSDLLEALRAPGRDPRDKLDPPELRSDVLSMEDLEEGMSLQGTVRNVVDFGAFVDVGVKNDGLLHVSQMADRYVDNPHEEVSVGDRIDVSVESVDVDAGELSLARQ